MRIVFMGTPDFAAGVLREVIAAGHEVIAVYTQPDKQKGRGKSLQYPPVKELAIEHGIEVRQPEKLREASVVEELKALAPELILVVAYGQILSEDVLRIPPYGCVNVHASLLPKYRGAAPIQRVIMDGEKVSGVTTMYMAKGLDTGDMIEKVEVPIDAKETGGTYHDKLMEAGAKLCVSTLEKIAAGTAPRTPQNDVESSYAHMLDKSMGNMDFTRSAAELERLIRGLNPWPSAYTRLEGRMLKIFDADLCEGEGAPGTVIEVTKKSFTVACGEGALRIRALQPEGKKCMDTAAFLNGCHMEVGTVLGN